ncbi:GDSL-type esterase/lipase family protein [Maribellus sp. YY47]|uniref:GDSL-type esterase/lipase family protein n=1 Tax=Maribellus sp. YY47 TaxID=2929486 RepID=UPI0020017CB2|nr:GDSL-type esterase/lipase family protein [Maribellus sp. YY47]MCK3685562.1 GDSL-type esterase/lipase family protein [Maribellus sp. YY47]
MSFLRFILFFLLCISSLSGGAQKRIKIACVGNSITYGATIENREINSYPAQLAVMLGERYDVRNFGRSGTTLLSKGDYPYIAYEEYQEALAFLPDWVFIKLGTNDTKPANRVFLDGFVDDYKKLISSFKQLPSHPRIVLLSPVPAFVEGDRGITASVIRDNILPKVRQVAFETGTEIVNLYNLFIDSPTLFTDGIHPSAEGATIIAQRVCDYIQTKNDSHLELISRLPSNTGSFNFYGFQGYEFDFNGRNAKIVVPKNAAKGNPWVWRARFWGHEPQFDIALLERGFHIVYCDVAELFGNKEALSTWNQFYKFLTKAGLSKQSVMEGMSRGGFYIYRWATKYPKRVAAIYADAPVLDIKSWPGGKGKSAGSLNDWETFKNDFALRCESEAMAFKGNPLDMTNKIVRGDYPILHVVGDADEVVPVEENTALFEKEIKKAGGGIHVIHKAGIGHHPHSLQNPQPIVDFTLEAYSKK